MADHDRNTTFICGYCGERFATEERRNRHEKKNKLDGKGCRR